MSLQHTSKSFRKFRNLKTSTSIIQQELYIHTEIRYTTSLCQLIYSAVFLLPLLKKKKKSARLCNTGIVAMNIINTFFASSSKKASESINPQVLRMPNTHVSALKYNKMQLLLHQTR